MPTQNIIRLTVPDLVAAVRCDAATAADWIDPLSGSAVIHEINTPKRMAAWLATIAHESASLSHLEENLNYSATRLLQVWPNRFGYGKANPAEYSGNPEKLANLVYANRMGNGDADSGDGWTYRGRGPIQLTGKANYAAAAAHIPSDIVRFPELVLEPPVGAFTAGWFWASNDLNQLADDDDFGTIVQKVNGGMTGYDDRLERWHQAQVAVSRFA